MVGLLCQIMKIALGCSRQIRHPKGAPQYDYAYPLKETETSALWMIDDLFITVRWDDGQIGISFIHDPIMQMKPEAQRVFMEIRELLAECEASESATTVH